MIGMQSTIMLQSTALLLNTSVLQLHTEEMMTGLLWGSCVAGKKLSHL